MKKIVLLVMLALTGADLAAQRVSYSLEDADVKTYNGSVHVRTNLSFNSVNGLGLNAGIMGDYRLKPIPLSLRGSFEMEVYGVGESEGLGEATDRFREIEVGGMFAILPGRAKTGSVKVVLDEWSSMTTNYSKFIRVDGQVKRDLLARGGAYHWGARAFRSTGVTAGIGFRVLKHAMISLRDEPDYTYSAYSNLLLYADIIVMPMNTLQEADLGAASEIEGMGWRVGIEHGHHESNRFIFEVSRRPGPGEEDWFFITCAYTLGWSLK